MRRIALLAGLLAALVLPANAEATFPGQNGKIAFHDGIPYTTGNEIYSVNPDGTGLTALTSGPPTFSSPAWSPDGRRIVFVRSRLIWIMNSDGTGLTQVTTTPIGGAQDDNPSWSPDGNRIVFDSIRDQAGPDIWSVNVDGSNLIRLQTDGQMPDWSPDGTRIAFASTFDRIWVMNADGSGATPVTPAEDLPSCATPFTRDLGDRDPDWSPDGVRLVYVQTSGAGPNRNCQAIRTIKPDGTDHRDVVSGDVVFEPAWSPDQTKIVFTFFSSAEFGSNGYGLDTINPDGTGRTHLHLPPGDPSVRMAAPDWQPITVHGYPRPRGATPLQISLVPAYNQCTAQNSTHGAPFAFPSCNAPSQSSGFLTVGTPDANGQGANSIGSVKYTELNEPLPLNPNNGDQSDVQVDFSLTDVRNKSDLSDYTGSLRLNSNLRITDHDNGAGTGSATVQDIPLALDVPCTATASGSTGSSCSLHSTAEAFVPGAVKERKRAIWELGQVQVYDGGADGNPASADNTLFAVQGVFVP